LVFSFIDIYDARNQKTQIYGTDSVPKRRHTKFKHRGITQKKAYSIQNMAKV